MSAMYVGTVRHRRFAVRRREFRHRLALAYVDLDGPPADAVRALTGRSSGAVRLLAHPRGFNPVAFYYCFDEHERLDAVVAEVTNTPWGEKHAYVLRGDGGTIDKQLHVSPFQAMDQTYAWRATAPGETLSVHIESRRGGERIFDATLALRRRPLSARRVAASALRVLPLIYGHALALWLRRVPVHAHP